MQEKNKQKIVQTIRRYRHFLISSHINPEGDCLGSALALRGLLVKLGKSVEMVWDGPIPRLYHFLPGISRVKEEPSRPYDAAFIVDCPTLGRIGQMQQFILKEKPLCVIDHHISNDHFGTVNWIDPKAAAVGEMIYALFETLGVKMDLADATNLYVSIVTDTGSFRYSNTTAKVHAVTSALIRKGVDPSQIASHLYESHSLQSRQLLAQALETLKVGVRGRLAWVSVTRKMLSQCKSSPEETEGIVDYARSLKGVKIAVFFREEGSGWVKVSFRSKGTLNVDGIARRFGGGGHRAASGCRIRAPLKDAQRIILREVKRKLA